MRFLIMIIITVIQISEGSAAHADVIGTKWTMTVDEVKSAHPDVKPVSNPKLNRPGTEALLLGIYDLGDFHFQVDYQFNQEKLLTRIGMSLTGLSPCLDLLRNLLMKYGNLTGPNRLVQTESYLWADLPKMTIIEYDYGVSGCDVVYSAIDKAKLDGL